MGEGENGAGMERALATLTKLRDEIKIHRLAVEAHAARLAKAADALAGNAELLAGLTDDIRSVKRALKKILERLDEMRENDDDDDDDDDDDGGGDDP